MKFRALIVLAAVLLIAPQANASIDWLVGGSVGNATLDAAAAPGSTSDLSWKAYAGMRIIKYVGIEGGYQNLGTSEFSQPGMDLSAEVTGWDGYVVGVFPIKKFEVFGKLGYMAWESDNTFDFGNGSSSITVDGGDIAYGLGGAFKATEHFAIRAEWEQFTFNSNDTINMYSLGLDWRF
jgi:outer membrane autotransporter protein